MRRFEMLRGRISMALASLSVLLAVGAAWFAAFWPFGVRKFESTSAGEWREWHSSLVQEEGWGVLFVLLIPAAISGGGLVASMWPRGLAKPLMWLAAILLLGFSVVSALSVGTFFAPAAIALLVAAILQRDPTTVSTGRS